MTLTFINFLTNKDLFRTGLTQMYPLQNKLTNWSSYLDWQGQKKNLKWMWFNVCNSWSLILKVTLLNLKAFPIMLMLYSSNTSLAPQLIGVLTGTDPSGGVIDKMSNEGPTSGERKGEVTRFNWMPYSSPAGGAL